MRRLGGCLACDKEVFDIAQAFSGRHPLAGQAQRLGKPHEDAIRLALVLMSGRVAMVTVCDDCANGEKLPIGEMWRRAMQRELWEHEHRAVMGIGPVTPEQEKTIRAGILERAHDVPVGILGSVRWRYHDQYR